MIYGSKYLWKKTQLKYNNTNSTSIYTVKDMVTTNQL